MQQDQIDSAQIWFFKPIDSLIEIHKNRNKEYFCKLFEQKKIIITKLRQGVITAKKYYSIVLKSYKQNDKLKQYAQMDLMEYKDIYQSNVEKWFQQKVNQTGLFYQEQEQLYNKYIQNNNNRQKQNKKQSKIKQSKIKQSKIQQKQVPKITIETNNNNNLPPITSCLGFAIFDELMNQYRNEKQFHHELLIKKKKFLDMYKNGDLNSQKYRDLLFKAKDKIAHEKLKKILTIQYETLQDLYNNDVKKWFTDIIHETKLYLQSQQDDDKQLQMNKILKPIIKNNNNNKDDSINLSDFSSDSNKNAIKVQIKSKIEIIEQQKKVKQVSQKRNQYNITQIYNFKVLDYFLQQYHQQFVAFNLFYKRKFQVKFKLKNIYKNNKILLQYNQRSQKIKEIVQNDLFNLTEIHQNDINQWFKELVQETELSFEQQQQIYNKYNNKSKQKSQIKISQIQKNKNKKQYWIGSKPKISQIVCFTAIYKLLKYYTQHKGQDKQYVFELIQKKDKLKNLLQQNRLNVQRYSQLMNKCIQSTQNQQLKRIVQIQIKDKNQKYNGNQKLWFEQISKQIYPQQSQIIDPILLQNQKVPKNTQQQCMQILRKLSVYESLIIYYMQNKINLTNNQYIIKYQKSIKPTLVKLIKQYLKSKSKSYLKTTSNNKQQQQQQFNPIPFANKHIKPITRQILSNLQQNETYSQKVIQMRQKFIKEINQWQNYSKKLRRNKNQYNIEISNKAIIKCKNQIQYLNNLIIPSKNLFALPLLKNDKKDMFSIDDNKLASNEIQIIIDQIKGINNPPYILKIFVINLSQHRFTTDVQNGKQNKLSIILIIPQKDMLKFMNNKYPQMIQIKFQKRGFFYGKNDIASAFLQANMSRNNICQETIDVDTMKISYCIKVKRANKPVTTVITINQLEKYPSFEHTSFIQEQFIKKCMPIQEPTMSELK